MLCPVCGSRNKLFLSTPSARRATSRHFLGEHTSKISIHALREEGDTSCGMLFFCLYYFYPRPPRGGRLTDWALEMEAKRFLSTPSARRATDLFETRQEANQISIHALREEGDFVTEHRADMGKAFLSTPSARRATRGGAHKEETAAYFYPRPPRGGRLQRTTRRAVTRRISIHALREEGDHAIGGRLLHIGKISIHALREEGDPVCHAPPFNWY